ncbi:MAG: hypothetical protein HC875_32465 [Anaerolineales bacterium]|nr:hypothetical protein [Anaerolineales bacterium]
MAKTFHCPNCNGPLDYQGDGLTVECPFCGSSVVVPESLRPPEPGSLNNVVIITTDRPAKAARPAAKNTSGGWIVGLLLIGLIGIIAFFVTLGPDGTPLGALFPPTATPTPTLTPSPTPFAPLVLSFGQKGSGPGFFADPRTLAVDTAGRIFVGDYLPGRIQAFAADGTFLWQQTIPTDNDTVGDLAADGPGQLYAVVGRDLYVYRADSGEPVAQWTTAPEHIGYYRAIAVTPKNEVVAVQERELVKLDRQGQLLLHLGGVEIDFLDQIGLSDAVDLVDMAVDGAGDIYIATSDNAVLKLDARGKVKGLINGPAQGEGLSSIAVAGGGKLPGVMTTIR